MSNCSCFSEERQSYWKRLVTKYEKRVRHLTAKRCEMKHRLEVMRLQMPAYFCYNLMKIPIGAEGHVEDIIKHLYAPSERPSGLSFNANCSCNPCTLRGSLRYHESTCNKNIHKKKYLSDMLLNRECKCEHCADTVIKKLQAEREEEEQKRMEFENKPRKPSIRRICHCDICRAMIPGRPSVKPNKLIKKEVLSVEPKKECACAKDGTESEEYKFKDTVCECAICAEETIRRIQSSDTKFKPVICGCEGSIESRTIPEIVDVPICACDSCKEELNKRIGLEEEVMEVSTDKCFCKSGEKTDWLCTCSTCAAGLRRTITIPCECNLKTDIGDAPLCACNTCKREIKEISIDDIVGCICKCRVCDEVRIEAERKAEAAKSVAREEEIKCICDCETCTIQRKQLIEYSQQISKEATTSTSNFDCYECSTDSSQSECIQYRAKVKNASDIICASETSSDSIKKPTIKKYRSEPCSHIRSVSTCFCSSTTTTTDTYITSSESASDESPEETPLKESLTSEESGTTPLKISLISAVSVDTEDKIPEKDLDTEPGTESIKSSRSEVSSTKIAVLEVISNIKSDESEISAPRDDEPDHIDSPTEKYVQIEVREVVTPATIVMDLHADPPPKAKNTDEYKRTFKEKWLKESISECSCVKDIEYDALGNRPMNCATDTDECCCKRYKTDKFSKLMVEAHVKVKPEANIQTDSGNSSRPP